MAENVSVATVYLSGSGLPREWFSKLTHALVAEHLAATGTVFERAHPDNGGDVLVRLHTRADHIEPIRQRAHLAEVRAYPLQCAPDYADWVRAETAAPAPTPGTGATKNVNQL
ncbi:divalent-cation tolerance protein CutA [Nocardia sp. NBC_01503]|uniref:hypothetical protein n=1 Tax=Nocardia sp. NBC_01503 TaxID=2975997 RepID=UPI002E7BE44D|nr:hypothetical protein [Nocardia sp. NBC_01503]WTL33362.1 divalent-cation tolerance protein CutA [Nocardia sp. NBC_01503]